MDVRVVSVRGIPEDATISIRAGNVRKQGAAVAGGAAFTFQQGTSTTDCVMKVDVMQVLGKGYLIMKPNQTEAKQYEVVLSGGQGDAAMGCELVVEPSNASLEVQDTAKADGQSAKEYLDSLGIVSFSQDVLKLIAEQRPGDPFAFAAKHFLSASEQAGAAVEPAEKQDILTAVNSVAQQISDLSASVEAKLAGGDTLGTMRSQARCAGDWSPNTKSFTSRSKTLHLPAAKLRNRPALVIQVEDAQKVYDAIVAADGADRVSQAMLEKFCMEELHLDLSQNEISRVFKAIDQNQSKDLTIEEFLEGCRKSNPVSHFMAMMVGVYHDRKRGIAAWEIPQAFDWTKSTSENYKNNFTDDFREEFGQARRLLDYSFHNNYTLDRQRWQDKMVAKVCKRTGRQPKPWVVYTCGTPGAGKGYAMSWMSQQGYFPLETVVHVDPDYFKMATPEWPKYKETGEESVDKVCGQEANFLADLAQHAAIIGRQNIWRDSTLVNGEFFKKQFQQIRAQFPEYQIAVFYIHADEATVRSRVQARAEATGRTVSADYLDEAFRKIRTSLTQVSDVVDFVATIDNSGKAGGVPLLESFRIVDRTHNWAAVRHRFARRYVAPESFPNALAPIFLRRRKEGAQDVVYDTDREDPVLKINFHSGDGSRRCSSEQVITMDQESREHASIPAAAKKLVYVYGCPFQDSPMRMGAFMYLDSKGQVLQLNELTVETTQNLIQFGEPLQVSPVTAEVLRLRSSPVTAEHLREGGAEDYAFIMPGENLPGDFTDLGHGGFVYLMNEEQHHRYFPIIADSAMTAEGSEL